MYNTILQRSLLVLLTPLLLISLSYFLFLSKPELFSGSIKKFKYKDYTFSFEEVITNKNPLYPEILFKNIFLQKNNEKIRIIELKMGLNILSYLFDDSSKINFLRIYASKIQTKDYISLLPDSSASLKKTLSNIISMGTIDELYLEFIDGAQIRINNELILSDVTLNIGNDRVIRAKNAFVAANNDEVKVILDKGYYENLPFEKISGLLDLDSMILKYTSYHNSINSYAENILPLGVLNFKKDIELFTSGISEFNESKNKNFGFISFQDLSEIKYLQDGFNIKTNIFIEDFSSIFSQNLISFNEFELNLFLFGNEIQKSSTFNFFSDSNSSLNLSGIFLDGNLKLDFNSENLKGSLIRDKSSFFKINLYDSNIYFDFAKSEQQNFVLPNLKFRLIGNNITLNDAKFDLVDFYYLKNGDILTLNDINIVSDFLNVANYEDEPAYFSINTKRDFYKVKGSYEFKDIKNSLKLESFPSIEYFKSNINVQWSKLLELQDIEGRLDFLAKDFQINQNNPNSALLNLVGLLNIESFFDGYDGSSTSEYIKFKRGSGSIIFSKQYGRIENRFSFEADFGDMNWDGFIIKDELGSFEELDLKLSLKLNLQKNIPWYAGIFGGLGVAAGTAIIGNVFEDQIENISTIEYSVKGPLDSPILERL